MYDFHKGFIGKAFLRSVWALDYKAFRGSDHEAKVYDRLKAWAERKDLKETSAESAFVDVFFHDLWGYSESGKRTDEHGYTLYPKYPVAGAGQKGGTGEADLAIGWFDREGVPATPQVLCEFKDIRSNLDAPQKGRKANTRSPVKQCLDYLGHARRCMYGNEAVLPTWGLVTDMNEFRLYWFDSGPQQYLRFVIRPTDLLQGAGLLTDNEETRFGRFLFWKLFHRDTLLTAGGKSLLATLIARQWIKEQELEKAFYREYKDFREKLFETLVGHNPSFPGTKGRLLRLAQKILDRCIFIFFCEDMGQTLSFPPQLMRDFLIYESKDEYYDPDASTIWQRLIQLFNAMNEGKPFGKYQIRQFNGGLFASDSELEGLTLPNKIFCQPNQGQNEVSLKAHPKTLLYLSASYNYASGWAEGLRPLPHESGVLAGADVIKADPSKSIGLYTLGRIFEQSITELEIREAEVDGLLSVSKESKRKRDGVYYTPEWVVERIVHETVGPVLRDLKRESGWPDEATGKLPDKAAIFAYRERLKEVKIVDPACGSGAFLITSLRYLLDEWHGLRGLALETLPKKDTQSFKTTEDEDLIRNILRGNIYGVDINPASVEIARLALWLHTASGNKPLSSLDKTVLDGNSLIDSTFFKGQDDLDLYDEGQKERINTFDWEKAFPEVFKRGGFDAVVGNPPYVKLQTFRKVHADMAEYLRDGRPDQKKYKSTQTGNFDLYLPFIEKGLNLLRDTGRLGFIAPSLWTMNDYGAGLRSYIATTKHLDRWIDFSAFQVFEEATTYTALQFFSKASNEAVQVAYAPSGAIPENPWEGDGCSLPYAKLDFGNRWLLLMGDERSLIDKLYKRCKRLDDATHTAGIFQGMVTSADPVFHLEKIGAGKYVCSPKEKSTPEYEVALEDGLMKPLVSGRDAKRYVVPDTKTFLLFPYDPFHANPHLISSCDLETDFPKSWAYLRSYEDSLRKREATLDGDGNIKKDSSGNDVKAPMNDDNKWWGYVYPKNLNKHELKKLIVPRIVSCLQVSVDVRGGLYLDNVDVGGVILADKEDPFFITGILNAPVANFVFKRISKPFRGEYRSANKQFIAPLPIPPADDKQKGEVATLAKGLQEKHTKRRDLLAGLEKRMGKARPKDRPLSFLFPDQKTVTDLKANAPKALDSASKQEWAKLRYEEEVQGRYDVITARLSPSASMEAEFTDGELLFRIDGVTVLAGIFLDEAEGPFIAAQWKVIAQTFNVTDKADGKKLCNALRKLADTDNKALIDQIISRQKELAALEAEIEKDEAEINELTFKLYGLTDEETAMVLAG